MVVEWCNIDDILIKYADAPISRKNKKSYVNLPLSFDIETTSFYKDGEHIYSNADVSINKSLTHTSIKCAVMYVWQLAIDEDVVIGRTWSQFVQMLARLQNVFNCYNNRYLIIYVHNLTYEFQFMRRWLTWKDVFALDNRVVVSATTDMNIIFRCSFKLSGYSLATVAKNLNISHLEKLSGYLSYTEMRHGETDLNEDEIAYCINDVLIVTAYISEQIISWGGIANIPLTQTGAIRRVTRKNCFKYSRYKWFIKKLTFQIPEYELVRKAYSGGFVHCNVMYISQVLSNVSSYDLTSSYPSVMVTEKFPMTKGIFLHIETEEDIIEMARRYCLILDVKFLNLKSKVLCERILSFSKCFEVSRDCLIDNGRVDSSGYVRVCLTEVDFLYVRKFYKWDDMRIVSCVMYEKRYLPKPIVETIIELYSKKTTLKDVKGREKEYFHSKELLNSMYGMCATNIVRDNFAYSNDVWAIEKCDVVDEIEKYNKGEGRFLFYVWGVYVTAYARRNLYDAILECGDDYVYSDTDSIKILNRKRHEEYFKRYNENIIKKVEAALQWHNIDVRAGSPMNLNGVKKPLGVWQYEGEYSKFKSLGAKRYLTYKDGKYTITVAGLSKQLGRDYVAGQKEPFTFFNDMMTIDRKHSGRLTHTYCDYEIQGQFIDLNGKRGSYYERSFVHIEESEYNLSLAKQYLDYILYRARMLK